MTSFLIDLASYQDGINLNVVKQAGFTKVNIKLSQGNWYRWGNAQRYIDEARSLGFGICTFHWLDSTDSGSNQAKIVQSLMKQFGIVEGTAHQCDCEDTKRPATFQIWKDYVNSMQNFLGRHIINYTGDWWWNPHIGTNNGNAITPHLWAAPNNGYKPTYPGDQSSDWVAGYGGWNDYSILQYSVSSISNAGGGSLSKSAIRDERIWDDLTEGGFDMEEFERKAGNADVQANAALNDYDSVKIKLADGNDFVVQNVAKKNRLAQQDAIMKTLNTLSTVQVDVDALAAKIAAALIASNANGLTQTDHDAVV